jgi:hypothetical protein
MVQCLAQPYFYGYLTFTEERRAAHLIAGLGRKPKFCVYLREIQMFMGRDFSNKPVQEIDMLRAAQYAVHLVRLVGGGGVPIRWAALSALAAPGVAGGTLREFTGHCVLPSDDNTKPQSPEILQHLVALQTLTWESTITFSVEDGEAPKNALPALRRVEVKSLQIIPLLAQME